VSSNDPAPPNPRPRGHAKITIRDLLVERGGRAVLAVDTLDIPTGKITAVIGPNGSGKSTLLRTLQLLISPTHGDLRIDGVPMRQDTLATRRRMASAFQEPLLLNTSVVKNVETALRLHGFPRAQRRDIATQWLDRFGVGSLAGRHARELSGGEAQRVSLARAFAVEPEVLLLDEPFSALDPPTRAALIEDFAGIARQTGVTVLLVTHDRDEALRLADEVVVLIAGHVRQYGPPQHLFAAPADPEVAEFVGVENVWPAPLEAVSQGVAVYRLGDHRLEVAAETLHDVPQAALFCIRPEQITVHLNHFTAGHALDAGSARNQLPATIVAIEPAGPVVRLRLAIDHPRTIPSDAASQRLVATVTQPSLENLNLHVGSRVTATFKATAAHVIPQHVTPPTD
jgi:tungstate transport system ATP-binding protein